MTVNRWRRNIIIRDVIYLSSAVNSISDYQTTICCLGTACVYSHKRTMNSGVRKHTYSTWCVNIRRNSKQNKSVLGKSQSRLRFKSWFEPLAPESSIWTGTIATRFKNFAIQFEKDLHRGNITYLLTFQSHCQTKVTWMYSWTRWFRFEHGRAKMWERC